jgi:hypothetical protein
MIGNIKNKVIALTVLVATITISATTFNPPAKPGEDSLILVMKQFSTALGVRCGFCHAANKDTSIHHPDFASDAKPEKAAARHMMKMTREINEDNFNWDNSTRPDTIHVVACITCHRGISQPDLKNIMAQLQTPVQPSVPVPPAPPAPPMKPNKQ